MTSSSYPYRPDSIASITSACHVNVPPFTTSIESQVAPIFPNLVKHSSQCAFSFAGVIRHRFSFLFLYPPRNSLKCKMGGALFSSVAGRALGDFSFRAKASRKEYVSDSNARVCSATNDSLLKKSAWNSRSYLRDHSDVVLSFRHVSTPSSKYLI